MMNDESHVHAILEYNPTGMIIVEKNTRRISYVNEAAARIIGLPKERISGKICHQFVCPAEKNKCPVSDLRQIVDRSERFLIRSDGTRIPILKTVVPIIIEGKDCLLESFIDISEHKQVAENLRQSEERYRAIFENTGNASVLSDENAMILLANSNFEKLSGYTKEELEGKMNWTAFIDGRDLVRLMQYREMRMEGIDGVRESEEFLFISRSGNKRNILLTLSRIPGTGISIASCMDISERRQAVEALIKSEEKFSKVFRANPVGVIITRFSDGLLMDTNEAFRRLLKYSQKDLVGKTVGEMNIWAVAEQRDRLLKQLESGPVRDVEICFRAKDGSEVMTRYSAEVLDISGETCILSLFVDTTEQKVAEEALKKSEKYFKAITESATDVLFIVDEKNIIKYATPSVAWVLGFLPEELIGKTAADLIFPDDLPRAAADFREALRTKDVPLSNKLRVRRKDGVVIVMEGIGRNLLDDPVIAGLVMNVRDVTESYRATEALMDSEKKFRSIVDSAFDCILIIDLQGIIRFVNNAALQAIKADSAEDMIGRNVIEFVAPESLEEVLKDFMEVAGGHDSYLAQYYLMTKRGDKICVESIGKLINYQGQPATIVSIRDVTGRNQAEEEKSKLQSQLLQAQKMESIGRLAGGVAHDFNNMLSVMRGHAEIAMARLEKDHPVKTNLLQIMEAAERSVNLTRQLLAFARQQTISPQVLELNDVVAGMLKLLKRLIGEDIVLAWVPGSNVWPIKIDPSQVDQILANLCVNARDAIDNVGKVTIETRNVHIDEDYCVDHAGCAPGDYVLLAVSDTGSGMDQETQAKIFEPFFTTKAVGKGTGLGLATVYGIVKQNKGFINVYSEPGMGTTFSIYIPSYQKRVGPDQEHEAPRPADGGDETILVVEDEPILLDLTRLMLEVKGYRVLTAGTPEEAIELARENTGEIKLLLTDVIMPGMNGRDLEHEIRSLVPDIKSLFMSGYTADVIGHHGVLDKGVHFIQKPTSIESLAKKVREVLDKN